MMLDLIRRDPALRALPKWLVTGPATTGLATGMIIGLAVAAGKRGEPAGGELPWAVNTALWLGLWFPAALYVAFAGGQRRCRPFEMALPLDARSLWRAHLIAMLIATLAIVALTTGVISVTLLPLPAARLSGVHTALARMVLALLAVLPLTAAAFLARRSVLAEAGRDRAQALYVGATLVVSLLLGRWLSGVPPVWSLLPAALGGGLLARAHARLPGAFALAPRRPVADFAPTLRRAARDAAPAMGSDAGTTRANLPAFLWRVLHHEARIYLYLPLLAVFGVMLSGALYAGDEPDDRFVNVILSWYMLMALVPFQARRLRVLDGLPISRDRLFAFLVLPGAACLLLGYVGGSVYASARARPEGQILYVAKDVDNALKGPFESFEIAWNRRAPTLDSPWGERHSAFTVALWPGGPVLYKPYTAPADASPDFLALQLSRALKARYGLDVPVAEARRRWITTDDAGRVVAVAESLPRSGEFPHLEAVGAGQTFPAIAALVGVPWLLLLALSLRAYRPNAGARLRKWGHLGLLGALMAFQLGLIALSVGKVTKTESWTAFWKILARHAADAVPGGTATLWVFAGLAVAGAYLVAQGRFREIEFPVAAGKGCP